MNFYKYIPHFEGSNRVTDHDAKENLLRLIVCMYEQCTFANFSSKKNKISLEGL